MQIGASPITDGAPILITRFVLLLPRKWLTTFVEPCGAHGGRFAKRPYSLQTEQAVFMVCVKIFLFIQSKSKNQREADCNSNLPRAYCLGNAKCAPAFSSKSVSCRSRCKRLFRDKQRGGRQCHRQSFVSVAQTPCLLYPREFVLPFPPKQTGIGNPYLWCSCRRPSCRRSSSRWHCSSG